MSYNNFNILPFYTNINSQVYKQWYAFKDNWPIISSTLEIIPFQLVAQKDIKSVSSIHLVNINTKTDINSGITPILITKSGYSIIMLYKGINSFTTPIHEGQYYMYFVVDGVTYYSDVISAISDLSKYVKITYWNDENLFYNGGEICYDNNFKYELYINTTIGKPEYEFEEELTTRLGYKFLELQISNKLYKFTFITTEPICDAMRLIRLSDYIQIEADNTTYNALTFSYNPEWETQGNLASVQVEFTIDTIIQKLPSFNRRQRENFYNALLSAENEPIMFDEQMVALYNNEFINNSSNLVNGKLIRELNEWADEDYKSTIYIAADDLKGQAKKLNLKDAINKLSASKWERVSSDESGNILPSQNWFLKPINAYHVVAQGDIISNYTGSFNSNLPVAIDYTTTGLFKAKSDGGLLYDANGWYINPDFAGGIDEAQLKKYLDSNGYVTNISLLNTTLTGYVIAKQYTALLPSDNILTAFGKLEKHFDDYVTLTTEQIITGIKWFNGIGTLKVGNKEDVYLSLGEGSGNCINGLKGTGSIANVYFNYLSSTSWTRVDASNNVVTTGDIVANSTGTAVAGLPVASDYTTTGLFKAKSDGGLLYDANGWYINPDFAGGGVSFVTGKALELTADNILNVLTGTTATTVCVGNDSRLSDKRSNPNKLSWTGYNTGDYDGSEAKSITLPSKVSQLTNDSGYITSINWSMVSNAVYNNTSGLGSGYYLNGNGELKKIAYSELSGLPDLSQFVTLTTSQTITGSKWFNGTSLLTVGPKTNVHIVFGAGAGNCINGLTSSEAIGNLYFNYVSSTSYTRIDGSNNFVTSGDVVANSTGAAVSGLPAADASTYGLVKYDNSTIKKNSSGQLYCTVSGGSGGSTVSWSGSLSSGTKIGTLTINGSNYSLYAPSSSGGTTVSWGTSSTQYAQLTVAGTTKNVSLNGHTHSYSTVSWSGSLSSGTKIGTLTINGSNYSLYAPSSSGGSSTFTLASATFNSEIIWGCSSSSYGIRIRRTGNSTETRISGNVIDGRNGSSYTIGNLYFNYASSSTNVRIDASGKIYSNGSQLSSDTRFKTVVGNETDVLDRMQKIPVIRYYRVNSIDKNEETGFGAQSFLGVFDNVTSVNPDTGYYVINSNAILSIAWQGVNELYTKLKEQQTTIDILQTKLDELTKIVTEMKGGNV